MVTRLITLRQANAILLYARATDETGLESFASSALNTIRASKQNPIAIPADLAPLVSRVIGPTDDEVRASAAHHADALICCRGV